MKTLRLLVIVVLSLVSFQLMAGGIVHNTNQSAAYMRTLNRNASIDQDAPFSNPAGVMNLGDGLYIALHSQTVWQTREIQSNFPNLNETIYEGKTFVPVLPDFYLTWKKNNLAVSALGMVVGGGGGAEFDKGLPSFAYNFAGLVGLPAGALNAALAPMGNITGYTADMEFTGSSAYYSGQVNVAYKLNDMFSVAMGGRYIMAGEAYEGSLKNISLITQYGGGSDGTQPGAITSAINPAFADIEVDAERSGTAFAGIFSVNAKPVDGLLVAARLETKAPLEMINDTKVDGSGLFPDGDTIPADMPMMLGIGLAYDISKALRAEVSWNYYFDKGVDWGGREDDIDENFREFGLSIQYAVSEKTKFSTGYLFAGSGVNDQYNSDLSYSLSTNTFAFGLNYGVSAKLNVDLGMSYTMYNEGTKPYSFTHPMTGMAFPITETYNKDARVLAIGLNYSL